ncbi:hypothetical protein BCR39DRAFT_599414 [Naematelia encephala]|uniref:Uncharacterized protein n=1 Tax=Naematelia encephala TaxID=71784 RepID=A0A1Y2AXM6_9TREE|nr:hypothetical protein BCR39DRAFT_599414 [Naematelia encephala]
MSSLYGSSLVPPTGPARVTECAQPRAVGQILPNGIRNPWAPYAGDTYVPFPESPRKTQQNQYQHGLGVGVGDRRARTRSMSMVGTAVGGVRIEDGRARIGHEPDLISTAGARPRLQSAGSWVNSPSSWANHTQARMTPVLVHSPLQPPPLQSPQIVSPSVAYSHTSRPRRVSYTPITIRGDSLPFGRSYATPTPARYRSPSAAESPVYRVLSLAGGDATPGSTPMSRVQELAGHGDGAQLERRGSRISGNSRRRRTCNSCKIRDVISRTLYKMCQYAYRVM